MGKAPIEGKELEEKTTDMTSALDKLDKILAVSGGEYLTGENFTLADLTIWTTLHSLVEPEIVSLADRENLQAWYKRSSE